MNARDSIHSSSDSNSEPKKIESEQPKSNTSKNGKPAKPMQKAFCLTWGAWIFYRLLIMPIAISFLSITHPDIAGGIFWHGLLLIPALAFTPWMMKGKSPFALLMGSMFTLVYFGASGVTLFSELYAPISSLLIVYGLDTCLLLMIHVLMFKLLKRLPKMNG